MSYWNPNQSRFEGIDCVCDECGKEFRLTGNDKWFDVDELGNRTDKKKADINICACDSGGIYGCYVECPYCNAKHDLY